MNMSSTSRPCSRWNQCETEVMGDFKGPDMHS